MADKGHLVKNVFYDPKPFFSDKQRARYRGYGAFPGPLFIDEADIEEEKRKQEKYNSSRMYRFKYHLKLFLLGMLLSVKWCHDNLYNWIRDFIVRLAEWIYSL